MSEVWLALDAVLGRQVAVKKLRTDDDAALDSVSIERMSREARAAARLNHPHAVAVHDLIHENGSPYLIMEFVEGENLAQRIRRSGPLDIESIARLGAEIAGALEVAHAMGIVHRDIKPANIMIDTRGFAKLADFGIARGIGDAELTDIGQMIGTVAYMAPETARDGSAGPATDVYSLGATLFAAAEGRSPFDDGTGSQTTATILLRLVSEAAPPAVRAGRLTPLLSRMLAQNPDDRPTAAEVHAALSPQHEMITSVPIDTVVRPDRARLVEELSKRDSEDDPSATRRRPSLASPPVERAIEIDDQAASPMPASPDEIESDPDEPDGAEHDGQIYLATTVRRPEAADFPGYVAADAATDSVGPADPDAEVDAGDPDDPATTSDTSSGDPRRRWLWAGAAVAIVAGGTVAAIALAGGSSPHQAKRLALPAAAAPSARPNTDVTTYPVGANPERVLADDNLLYVAADIPGLNAGGELRTFNTTTLKRVGTPLALPGKPITLVNEPDSDQVWVQCRTTSGAGVIEVVNRSSGSFSRIRTAPSPSGIAFSPTGTTAYVTSYSTRQIQTIDTTHLTRPATHWLTLPAHPSAIYEANDNLVWKLYVTEIGTKNQGTLAVIDPVKGNVAQSVPVGAGPEYVSTSPKGTTVYVANTSDNTFNAIKRKPTSKSPFKIDAATPTGPAPDSIATVNGSGLIFVTDSGGKEVQMAQRDNDQMIKTFPVGTDPVSITIDPNDEIAYVANKSDGTVSVLRFGA